MDWRDGALGVAGIIGCAVAIAHGVLVQRLMVRPFQELAATQFASSIRRLVPGLLQFSTFNWFIGGLALVVGAYALGWEARLAIGMLVGSSYLFGALGNLWATRGRHPGWVLYAAAVLLIIYGVGGPSG